MGEWWAGQGGRGAKQERTWGGCLADLWAGPSRKGLNKSSTPGQDGPEDRKPSVNLTPACSNQAIYNYQMHGCETIFPFLAHSSRLGHWRERRKGWLHLCPPHSSHTKIQMKITFPHPLQTQQVTWPLPSSLENISGICSYFTKGMEAHLAGFKNLDLICCSPGTSTQKQ